MTEHCAPTYISELTPERHDTIISSAPEETEERPLIDIKSDQIKLQIEKVYLDHYKTLDKVLDPTFIAKKAELRALIGPDATDEFLDELFSQEVV